MTTSSDNRAPAPVTKPGFYEVRTPDPERLVHHRHRCRCRRRHEGLVINRTQRTRPSTEARRHGLLRVSWMRAGPGQAQNSWL
jgi:hypothetical protein